MALAVFVLSVTRAAMYDRSLCEEFEGVETGRASDPHIWKLNMGDGRTIVVNDAQAVRGTKSARVQVTQDRQWAYIETSAILPEAANGFWGRLYLRLDSERTGEGLVHWNIVEAVAERNPIKMCRYGGISIPELGQKYFNWNHEIRPRPPGFNELGVYDDFDAHVEAGVWHCIEWLFDPGTDTSRFIWNGEERSALNVAGMANTIAFDMPQLRALNVGFTVYQPIARDFTVWIDEIAVSNSRIG